MRHFHAVWLAGLALACSGSVEGYDAGPDAGGPDAGVDAGPPEPLDAGPGVAPVISNLRLSPGTATLGDGSGTLPGTLTFDFADPDGDVVLIRLTVGSVTQDFPVASVSGSPSGTLQKPLALSTAVLGLTTFQVAALDARGHRSNILATVFQVTEPPPTIAVLSPVTAVAGGPAFTLEVWGAGFGPGATVLWNGAPRPTTFVSATELTAAIGAADIAAGGASLVTVLGAGPTGASSSPSLFSAGGLDTRVVNEPTNDVAWDPWHGRLYASVPGTSATRGNSVLVIDPATGAVLRSVLVGSEPSRLAVSGDGRFLYVGLDGASAVKRYLLPDLTLDLTIPLGSHPAFGPYQALDLQVAPGAPGTVAVSLGATAASPLAQGGVAIFDEGMPRAERAEGPASLFDSLQWSPDAGTLYAANGETSDFDFYVLDVSPAGVALAEDLLNVFHTYDNRLHLDPGGRYLYSDSGQVLDTTTRLLLGTFPTAGPMVPAPDLNTAWFLTPASGQAGFFGVSAYHLLRLTPLAAERVPLVAGFDRVPPRLVRWGTQGLAACGLGQPLLISSGPFLATPAP